jgi:hypothetical protein
LVRLVRAENGATRYMKIFSCLRSSVPVVNRSGGKAPTYITQSQGRLADATRPFPSRFFKTEVIAAMEGQWSKCLMRFTAGDGSLRFVSHKRWSAAARRGN